MQFLILGAAAGGGLPQWNCGCQNCQDARAGKIPAASQSSLAVSVGGGAWAILNASPDIRAQMQASPQLHPSALRHSPVGSVLVTNGDIDHIAGLLSLREKTGFTLRATREILDLLNANSLFQALDSALVSRSPVELAVPFDLLPGLSAKVMPVPGKVPLFMEQGEVQTDLIGEQTVGVRLQAGNKVAYYIPGCADVTPALLDDLTDADLLLFDGTLWQDDELLATGTGTKTGKRMGHISMSGPDGAIARLKHLTCPKIFVHMNNTNPVWQPASEERRFAEEHGWQIAYDGLEIEI